MPLPSKRDPEQLRVALREALSEHFDGPIDIGPVAAPPTTGMSSETLLFDLIRDDGSQPLVARLRPAMDDLPVFPEYDLSKQARIMRIVGEHTDVPVPEILIEEPDEGVLGAPFIVMSRVEGEALPDMMPYTLGGSFLDEFSPDERSEFRTVFMSVLARLHAIDPADVDLSFIAPVEGDALGRQLAAQRAYYEWAWEGTDLPLIVRGLDWLDAHRPHDPGPTRAQLGRLTTGQPARRRGSSRRPPSTGRWSTSALPVWMSAGRCSCISSSSTSPRSTSCRAFPTSSSPPLPTTTTSPPAAR